MCSIGAGLGLLMGGMSMYQQNQKNKQLLANNKMVLEQQRFASNNAFANYGLEAFQQKLDLNEDELQGRMGKIQTTREAVKERAKVVGRMAESGISGNGVLAMLGNVDMQEGIAKDTIDTSLDSSKRNFLLREGTSYQKLQSSLIGSQFQAALNQRTPTSGLSMGINALNSGLQGYSLGRSFKDTTGNKGKR